MPLPTDPLLASQWHLINNVPGEFDLNVAGVWNPTSGNAYTGAGIWVVVIDDGFDYTHADLAPNYDTSLDFDFEGANDFDPFGLGTDSHGTAVAGIIGADNNGSGAVGVAFDSLMIGYRVENLISDTWLVSISESINAAATSANGDVVNISQGIANDTESEFANGYTLSLFNNIRTSIGTAVDSGRFGLGSIIVKSAGNSRLDNYDVNSDLWGNDTRQVIVAAVDPNGFVSSYSSFGAAILVSAFGGPGSVVTTDRVGADGYDPDNFTETFNGTSSAAPMVSGVVALMLEANPNLGWRDVQSILANSARHVGSAVGAGPGGSELFSWDFNAAATWNGGGLHFSNDYGYGLIDALAAVRMAETWHQGSFTAATTANQFLQTIDVLNVPTVIPDGNGAGLTFSGNAGFADIVERVTVTVTFSTTYMADVKIYLTSPDGTESILTRDQAGELDFDGVWTFESQAFRGERADGVWSVRIVDAFSSDVLTVTDVRVQVFGADTTQDRYVYTNEYSEYASLYGHAVTVTDTNGGAADTVNAAAVTTGSTIRLNGTSSVIDGVTTLFVNIENAVGGAANDVITGGAGANALYGNAGRDSISGGAGGDALFGGDEVGAGDNLYGGTENDQLYGEGGNDNLYGEAGADWLYGGDGNDFLYADGLDTVVNGGSGYDWVVGLGSATGITLNLGASQVEGVQGSHQADNLNASSAAAAVVIYGFGGVDTLIGSAFNDYLYFDGTDVSGGNLLGNAGFDWALNNGAVGAALNIATRGIEGYYGNLVAETISANGATAGVIIYGNGGGDVIEGSGFGDYIYFEADTVSINGGAGIDYAIYNPVSVVVGVTLNLTASNIEIAVGRTGGDTLNAAGATWNVQILGGGGGDTITAGNAGSTLKGEAGIDVLISGAGTDYMFGGTQFDTFRFDDGGGVDYIYDWQDGTDRIDLSLVAGINGFGDLTITNGGSNWYGVNYGAGTVWVQTGGVGALDATDFFY